MWRHDSGIIGLGVSGSGDVLAGIIVGLAARGATLEQSGCVGSRAACAFAGTQLASRFRPLGYMALKLRRKFRR